MNVLTVDDVAVDGKRVLVREDLNVPVKEGFITSDQRLQAVLPTLQNLLDRGAKLILCSHMGRPQEGSFDKRYSLQPVAEYLGQHLSVPVRLVDDYLDGVERRDNEVILCENVRFNVGEKANDETLSRKLAALCDVFVMDAFGTAHRCHASTCGVVRYAPVAVAGPLLIKELAAIEQAFADPKKPIVAIVGGSKISSKLTLLRQMIEKVDVLIVGGGIANTFLKAKGVEVGRSLYETDLVDEARVIMDLAAEKGCEVPLPVDAVVSKTFAENSPAYNKSLAQLAGDDMILDIGVETAALYVSAIEKAKTIIWNGPVGVFEFPQFAYGTRSIAFAIAESEAFSIAGGGDTLAAIDLYDLNRKLSYISTGGGAFLACLEGATLPALAILQERS